MTRPRALLALLLALTLTVASVAAETQDEDSPFNYVTSNLLAQLLVLLLIFFGSCIGVCCLMKIDTPTMFSDKPLVINKEY
ncbi:hypothetical protein, conserved [Eimeria necatrix]|uniref:Transmembrane protein n=1 Tax=Eimeria necatrix TaxID=51315 RepID=U6MEA2_9EIME|nr:hypothetical protein, conserved [Eimeria necatrix]CDJ62356.1 hypothetical protein, conserved [Eimeria necatrix]